jgi:CRP-like cAMP-binding protein
MQATEHLLRKLQIATSFDADAKAIERLPVIIKEIPAHTAIVREGERPTQCCLLVDGLACRSKTTDAGKRQILYIDIPGDIPDLHGLHLHVMDHDVTTLSPSTVGFIPHEALRTLARERPEIAEALWRETLIEAAVFREWIVNVGRRSAMARLAHLLTEIGRRLQAMGLAPGDRFELPMTQLDIADALGLTPVHVNRVVQKLRRAGLLEMRNQAVFLPDLPRLKALGDFDDLYLHQSETVGRARAGLLADGFVRLNA